MKTAEDILRENKKYHSLQNLVLICEAMDEFANAKLEQSAEIAFYAISEGKNESVVENLILELKI